MPERKSILRRVQRQFGRTAQAYVKSTGHAAGRDLRLLVSHAGELQGKLALDIATGGGHTAIALARAGAKVTAIDITYEMLDAASRFASEQGADIEFIQCAAEELSFESDVFDLVTCRIAPHHFADPQKFVSEVYRVLVPGGRFLMIDNITPVDSRLADAMNEVEKRRDPSHVEAYSVHQWFAWLIDGGFDPDLLIRWRKTKQFREWTEMAQLPDEEISALENDILDFPDRTRSYLRVTVRDGRIETLDHEAALFGARHPPADPNESRS